MLCIFACLDEFFVAAMATVSIVVCHFSFLKRNYCQQVESSVFDLYWVSELEIQLPELMY